MKFICSILVMCILAGFTMGKPGEDNNAKKLTISGTVRDKKNGEDLIGVTILVEEIRNGTITNLYGYYSLALLPGDYNLVYSYIGYNAIKKTINLKENVTLNIELAPEEKAIEEIVISGERSNVNVKSAEMSVVKMQMQTIRRIPALMGEVDIIKAIQLLPGVQSTSEGGSGFSVRGGAADQNLILLDEATVYNASHLMGFFSVFNNDAVKDVKLYKGDIPASNGGRLSSLLDIRLKDGNSKRFSGTGGIGTISSRLTLEGPIIKDKTSFIISGRRMYIDLFMPFFKQTRDSKLYFYDANLKVNHIIDENNRIFLSGYFGRDVFKNRDARMAYGNQTLTFRWNHLFSKSLFSNFTFIRSKYDYDLGSTQGANGFLWTSNLVDHGIKADFTYYPNPNNEVKFGISSTAHKFVPAKIKGIGDQTIFNTFIIPDGYALESGIYVMNEQKLGSRLTLKYGLRYSLFDNVGKGTIYNYDTLYKVIDSVTYKSMDFFNSYGGLEPRAGMIFTLSESSSIKANYSRTRQYLQLAQNSNAGFPFDIWFPANPNIKPQIADQVALGYFHNFLSDKLETSVEIYYKKMNNTIDFKDHALLLMNPKLDGEIRVGKSVAYGMEFFVKYSGNRLNGWISYTLSKTERTIPLINNGRTYPAPYDKTHNISIVCNYDITKRLSASVNWIYSSGQTMTVPSGRYEIDGSDVPIYTERNGFRMPDYHRLDLSLTLKNKQKEGKRWNSEWNFSLYNAYGRKNAWVINFTPEYTEKIYLFTYVPSVTYNFNF